FSSPPAPPQISPLSLHDALPICQEAADARGQPDHGPALQSIQAEPLSERHPTAPKAPPTIGQIEHVTKELVPRADQSSSTTRPRSEEHTSELQSRSDLVCRLLLE